LLIEALTAIVGKEHASDDPEVRQRYAGDLSLVTPRRPNYVVYPADTEQVQAVVKLANQHQVAVTPRSSAVSFTGAGIPGEGGIVVDLGRMNRILEIEPKDRKVRVEPGATWGQVQAELGKQGFMVSGPLLPHHDRSVLTSAMQREPMVICKSEYGEPLMSGEIVLGSGDLYWTGTAIAKGMIGQTNPETFLIGTRLFHGHQGTLGIFTWANIKMELIPSRDKLYFIPCDDIVDVAPPLYRIQRLMMGSECLVLNNFNLASLLAQQGIGDFDQLRQALPRYTIIQVLSGLRRQPEGRIAYEEAALMRLAAEMGFGPVTTLADIPGLDQVILNLLRKPWPGDTYWKLYPRGASAQIFFHVILSRALEFARAMAEVATKYDYPAQDIGLYVQPIERARMGYHEYSFHYDPDSPGDKERIGSLFLEASRRVVDMGGMFTTPYGPWADMVFSRAAGYVPLMRAVKTSLDPNNIMNPGKLCF